ncbi:hypothetical protein [Microvirga brassicacearum]|uniref:Uncharacterized protein n=1 Tax=Microvirga brassicacearum TaxID=2580413 RepID=A0A5N3P5X1_9HYPH|nr:hypothetical protein [Microvirga brassicacearum]KAB0265120.1 hypothetical protein FEZ63_19950 [Microvirga brassicacearum]
MNSRPLPYQGSDPADLQAFITSSFITTGAYSGLDVNGTMFLTRDQAGLSTLQDWLDRGAEILEFHQTMTSSARPAFLHRTCRDLEKRSSFALLRGL